MSRTLFIDPVGGVAGDMLVAALADVHGSLEPAQNALQPLRTHLDVRLRRVVRCGISARKFDVLLTSGDDAHDAHGGPAAEVAPHGHGVHLADVFAWLDQCALSPRAQALARAAYTALAEAEAAAHGVRVDAVHFHEVGALDAIADVAAAAALLDALDVDTVHVGPLDAGTGTVRCAHGEMPVPAPATAHLLEGLPQRARVLQGEAITPTGAACLRAWCTPDRAAAFTTRKTGYGAGSRDPKTHANVVRIELREVAQSATSTGPGDVVTILETHLDDVTGEQLATALDAVRTAGAIDAWSVGTTGKKGRPGHAVTVLCQPTQARAVWQVLFAHTGTLGVRVREATRWLATRAMLDVGGVPVKRASVGTVTGHKAEWDACVARAPHAPYATKRAAEHASVRRARSETAAHDASSGGG